MQVHWVPVFPVQDLPCLHLQMGKETAHKVSQAMARILQDTEIPYQTWVSSINQKGTTTTDSYEI